MSDNTKKNLSRQLFRTNNKNKKTECRDIVSQAEKIVTDYIYQRKNEIINKYCKKNNGIYYTLLGFVLSAVLCTLYFATK